MTSFFINVISGGNFAHGFVFHAKHIQTFGSNFDGGLIQLKIVALPVIRLSSNFQGFL